MIIQNLTYHAQIERAARFEYIATTIGFGNKEIANQIFKSPSSPNKASKSVLMDNGVILVYSCENNKLITGYIASVKQAVAIYRKCHSGARCPKNLMNTLYKNQPIAALQP